MSQYVETRERTISEIEKAYFDLYIQDKKITVSEICKTAGIHRSTFYFYFAWVDDVLTGIKTKLLNKLIRIVESKERENQDFRQIQMNLRQISSRRRNFFEILVTVYQKNSRQTFFQLRRKFLSITSQMQESIHVIENIFLAHVAKTFSRLCQDIIADSVPPLQIFPE